MSKTASLSAVFNMLGIDKQYELGYGAISGGQETVYVKISYELDAANNLQFTTDPASCVFQSGMVDEIVKTLLTGIGQLPPQVALHCEPLEIPVEKPCYVILQIDPTKTWQFISSVPAIMLADDLGAHYSGLFHAALDGTAVKARIRRNHESGKCHTVYFSVRDPKTFKKDEPHHFNLYIRLEQTGLRALPVILDPDIKNTGGGSYVPLGAAAQRKRAQKGGK